MFFVVCCPGYFMVAIFWDMCYYTINILYFTWSRSFRFGCVTTCLWQLKYGVFFLRFFQAFKNQLRRQIPLLACTSAVLLMVMVYIMHKDGLLHSIYGQMKRIQEKILF